MPDPSRYEKRSEWMAACVPAVKEEGREHDQAVAQCLGMWRSRKRNASASFTDEDADEPEWKALHRVADRHSGRMGRMFLAAVRKVRDALDEQELIDALTMGSEDAVIGAVAFDTRFNLDSELTPLYREVSIEGAEASARVFNRHRQRNAGRFAQPEPGARLVFDDRHPFSIIAARQETADLVREISEDQRNAIRATLARSFELGRTHKRTAQIIRRRIGLTTRQVETLERAAARMIARGATDEQVERFLKRRSARALRLRSLNIARTETIRASHIGQLESWRQAEREGLIEKATVKRVWIVTPDDRLDLIVCAPMADQSVDFDEAFETGLGDHVMTPPAHPQCRCSVRLELEED